MIEKSNRLELTFAKGTGNAPVVRCYGGESGNKIFLPPRDDRSLILAPRLRTRNGGRL
jgi:hypothetical protein